MPSDQKFKYGYEVRSRTTTHAMEFCGLNLQQWCSKRIVEYPCDTVVFGKAFLQAGN